MTLSVLGAQAQAGAVSENFAASSEHAIASSGHTAAAGVSAISGAAAVPLLSIGAVGAGANELGTTLWDTAEQGVTGPLPISADVHTVGPSPDIAIHELGK